MASKASAEFAKTLALAEALHRLESGFNDPPRPSVPNEVESVSGLRGGAVVLMVGAFEKFAKDVVQEHLTPFGSAPPRKKLDTLPIGIQVGVIFKSIDAAVKGPRHGAAGGKEERLPDVRRVASLINDGRIDVSALGSADGNIDAKGLSAVLKVVGIEDPLAKLRAVFDREWVKPEAHQFVHDKLTSIVLSRHRAAHAASVLDIGRSDVEEGIRFLKALAIAIDELLALHVGGL